MAARAVGSRFRFQKCLLISLLFLAPLSQLRIIGFSVRTSPVLDLQIATDKQMYNVGDSVTITGNVTLDGVLQNSTLVGVEVADPFGNPYLIRTVDSGNVSNQSWYLEIVDLYTCDGQLNRQTVFSRGTRDAYLNVTVRNNNPVNTYHIVGGAYVQSSNNTSLQAFFPFETYIGANATAKFLQSFSIPDDAPTGQARLFASVFSDMPVFGGYPLCPERSINISIESPTPQMPQPPQHFNVTFDFPLADVILGHYAVYGNAYYQPQLVSRMKLFTVIRIRDISVTNVTSVKTLIGKGYGGTMTISIQNQGNFTETFNVALYTNDTINTIMEDISVENESSKVILMALNTSELAYGNYTISASAGPGETNNGSCSTPIHVGVPGDVSGLAQGFYDGTTNMRDISYMILLFNTRPSSTDWKPNADVNNDDVVNMRDIAIAIINFNKHE